VSDSRFNGPLAQLLRETFPGAQPDPWPPEVDATVRARDARPLCLNCTYPQEERRWFCPNCGFPAGEYVATMPYLYIFLLGEGMRRGVTGPPERNLPRTLFYVLFSASQYSVFAPVYWFWMTRRADGHPICQNPGRDFDPGETPEAGAGPQAGGGDP
jgi:hypothetical protein